MRDFDALYQDVSMAVFGENGDFPDLVEQASAQGGFRNNRMVFLVLHELDGRVMDTTQKLAAGGMAVVVYAVTDQDVREYIRQSGGRRRIFQISIEESLEGRL